MPRVKTLPIISKSLVELKIRSVWINLIDKEDIMLVKHGESQGNAHPILSFQKLLLIDSAIKIPL
jgi:hypothetical protein